VGSIFPFSSSHLSIKIRRRKDLEPKLIMSLSVFRGGCVSRFWDKTFLSYIALLQREREDDRNDNENGRRP